MTQTCRNYYCITNTFSPKFKFPHLEYIFSFFICRKFCIFAQLFSFNRIKFSHWYSIIIRLFLIYFDLLYPCGLFSLSFLIKILQSCVVTLNACYMFHVICHFIYVSAVHSGAARRISFGVAALRLQKHSRWANHVQSKWSFKDFFYQFHNYHSISIYLSI